ncbi:hypothetical protein N9917_01390 [Deltaproteobacteria bacterium]|nr:hypothetical protein [Deltaproteobacteria bacterium]
MKTKPAIIEAVRFVTKLSPHAVEWRQIPRLLTNAGFHRRDGVLNAALRELEADGKIIVIRRGRSREDWDVELPESA